VLYWNLEKIATQLDFNSAKARSFYFIIFFYRGKINKIKKKHPRLQAFWVQADCNFPTTILPIVHKLIQIV